MNPWALVILGIGVLLIIMGVKGSYGGVIGALTGHPYSGAGNTSTSTGGKTAKGPLNPSRAQGTGPGGTPVGGGHTG